CAYCSYYFDCIFNTLQLRRTILQHLAIVAKRVASKPKCI
ncbi:MAG: hypothetical protein ACI9WT_002282, partial [Flavobacterium sp.]